MNILDLLSSVSVTMTLTVTYGILLAALVLFVIRCVYKLIEFIVKDFELGGWCVSVFAILGFVVTALNWR